MIAGPALLSIARFPAAIVFLDPPYTLDRELLAALDLLGPMPPPLVIASTPSACPSPKPSPPCAAPAWSNKATTP